jgi:Protein of unknown function (DUF3325)
VPDAVTMGRPLLLAAALLCTTCGLGWLALAMETHWQQVRAEVAAGRGTVRRLRALGTLALLLGLWLCLSADHATMAVLVWVMAIAGSALMIAFTLSWRPHWLLPLVAWIRPGAGDR